MIELFLGGARSGKSRLAEATAQHLDGKVVYIATAQALDCEMTARIAHHQRQRPSDWVTIEEPIALAKAITQSVEQSDVVLVDCLTLWLTNVLLIADNAIFAQHMTDFLAVLAKFPTDKTLILVSNETGLGVVPLGEISRKFVDESGWLHQKLASLADKVTFCVAGLPMVLKS